MRKANLLIGQEYTSKLVLSLGLFLWVAQAVVIQAMYSYMLIKASSITSKITSLMESTVQGMSSIQKYFQIN